jgi:hypothetical protein
MLEKAVEAYFKKVVEQLGGKSYKFTSPAHRGVADRVACLPDGSCWFVEIKTEGGKLSELQKLFASDMQRLNQHYACLWNKDDIDLWKLDYLRKNG